MPRSTRDRPAKPPLSREAIVTAALAVLRGDGLDAVTMRRVAAELDTGPASLYVYVANRDELLHALLDAVAGMLPLEPVDPARWREQLRELALTMIGLYAEHPGLARVALAYIPLDDNLLRVGEHMLALLSAGGIEGLVASYAVDTLALYLAATGLEAELWDVPKLEPGAQDRHQGHREMLDRVEQRYATLPPEEFPFLTRMAPLLTDDDGEARFLFGLDAIVDGALAALARKGGSGQWAT